MEGGNKPQEERDILEYETTVPPFTGRHEKHKHATAF